MDDVNGQARGTLQEAEFEEACRDFHRLCLQEPENKDVGFRVDLLHRVRMHRM